MRGCPTGGKRKLTPADVLEIRRLTNVVTQASLARRFNVSRILIKHIQVGKLWKKLGGVQPYRGRKLGPLAHNWNGGMKQKGAYMYILRPDHPLAITRGYVKRSHLVMERVLGRLIEPNEIVHHINGNTLDDRPENLQVMTSAEHTRMHSIERHARTGYNRGAKHPQAKLTIETSRMIAARLAAGVRSENALGREFGVSQPIIRQIRLRQHWTMREAS